MSETSPAAKNESPAYRWLLSLRWGAAAGEVLVILLARFAWGVDLDVPLLLALVAATVVTNVVATRLVLSPALLLGVDVVVLTALLALTGGPTNPFSALYIVYVTLAATTQSKRVTYGLTALSVAAYGALFYLHRPLAGLSHEHHAAPAQMAQHGQHGQHAQHAQHTMEGMAAAADGGYAAHLYGMFFAFALSAGLIAFFVSRLSHALREREAELRQSREREAQATRLASLTTLSAGAAHELGTPLGTIALVAGELDKRAAKLDDEALGQDAGLIRSEVRRCREILDRMAARAGDTVGEVAAWRTVGELLEDVRARLHPTVAARVLLGKDAGEARIHVPPTAFVQVLENVVRNGLDASGAQPVVIDVSGTAGGVQRIEVRDQGAGMSEETLQRAGEPFFTTKDAGQGMGLGLYLARAVMHQLGGELGIQSRAGDGTIVRLELPA